MMFRRKSMRAKVLPLGAMGIRAWPEQNFLFEILMSMQEGEKWIYNHFIQLRGTHYINRAWNKTDSSDSSHFPAVCLKRCFASIPL